MADEQNLPRTNQTIAWRLGCGCLGAIGCLGLLLIVLAVVAVVTVGLLFTAPPLEFMSQLNDFVANEMGWTMVILVLVALAVGGFLGYFAGSLIARRRVNADSPTVQNPR